MRTTKLWHVIVMEDVQLRGSSVKKVSNLTGTTILTRNSLELMDPSKRPWYMKGGTRRPYPAIKSHRTGRRLARLWPDEDAYDDRVTNQVSFDQFAATISVFDRVDDNLIIGICNLGRAVATIHFCRIGVI